MQVKSDSSFVNKISGKKLDSKMPSRMDWSPILLGMPFRTKIQSENIFQPLTILEIEAVHKNKGTLENFKEIKISTFPDHTHWYL
jgi:hypothetical protein